MDAGLDIPGSSTHVGKAGWLYGEVIAVGPAYQGVQTKLGIDLPVEFPVLATVVAFDNPRCPISEAARHPAFEQPGRLHKMVVNRNERITNVLRLGVGKQPITGPLVNVDDGHGRSLVTIVNARPFQPQFCGRTAATGLFSPGRLPGTPG